MTTSHSGVVSWTGGQVPRESRPLPPRNKQHVQCHWDPVPLTFHRHRNTTGYTLPFPPPTPFVTHHEVGQHQHPGYAHQHRPNVAIRDYETLWAWHFIPPPIPGISPWIAPAITLDEPHQALTWPDSPVDPFRKVDISSLQSVRPPSPPLTPPKREETSSGTADPLSPLPSLPANPVPTKDAQVEQWPRSADTESAARIDVTEQKSPITSSTTPIWAEPRKKSDEQMKIQDEDSQGEDTVIVVARSGNLGDRARTPTPESPLPKRSHKRRRIVSTPSSSPPAAAPLVSAHSQRAERYQRRQLQADMQGGHGENKAGLSTRRQSIKPARKPRRNVESERPTRDETETSTESWRDMTPSPQLSARAERAFCEKYFYVWSYEREDSGEVKLVDLLGITEADEKAWELEERMSGDEVTII